MCAGTARGNPMVVETVLARCCLCFRACKSAPGQALQVIQRQTVDFESSGPGLSSRTAYCVSFNWLMLLAMVRKAV